MKRPALQGISPNRFAWNWLPGGAARSPAVAR